MGKSVALIAFLLYIIVGLYLINMSFNFFVVPNIFVLVEKWILFLAGILTIAGGINYLRSNKNKNY